MPVVPAIPEAEAGESLEAGRQKLQLAEIAPLYSSLGNKSETLLSILDRSMRQKINKDIQDLNSDLDQADLVDIYRTLHPKSTEYTFFSAPHCTYFKI